MSGFDVPGEVKVPSATPEAYVKVAELLSAVSGAPAEAELTGQQEVLSAYRRMVGAGSQTPVRSRRRRTVISSILSAKLAAAVAAAAVPLGGLSAAAFTGSLPDSAQHFAHDTIGAPDVSSNLSDEDSVTPESSVEPTLTGQPTPTATASSHGPDVTGPAAAGLCNAWRAGGLGAKSVPLANLVAAAGDKDDVAEFCATVLGIGVTPTPTATKSDDDADEPAEQESGANKGSEHAQGKKPTPTETESSSKGRS